MRAVMTLPDRGKRRRIPGLSGIGRSSEIGKHAKNAYFPIRMSQPDWPLHRNSCVEAAVTLRS
jgi:hypothetical protein